MQRAICFYFFPNERKAAVLDKKLEKCFKMIKKICAYREFDSTSFGYFLKKWIKFYLAYELLREKNRDELL